MPCNPPPKVALSPSTTPDCQPTARTKKQGGKEGREKEGKKMHKQCSATAKSQPQ